MMRMRLLRPGRRGGYVVTIRTEFEVTRSTAQYLLAWEFDAQRENAPKNADALATFLRDAHHRHGEEGVHDLATADREGLGWAHLHLDELGWEGPDARDARR